VARISFFSGIVCGLERGRVRTAAHPRPLHRRSRLDRPHRL